MTNDNFGNRIKGYEATSDFTLTSRLPVILRLDGNSFSKFTKQQHFKKPFDDTFSNAMWETAKAVLKYCSGSQVAYIQSDEITVLLRNDLSLDTSPFLANRINKICSLVASTASVTFCNYLNKQRVEVNESDEGVSYVETNFIDAVFDLRAFVVPPNEVNNVFLWRQQDAFKNCVSAVAWYGLGEKHGKKTTQKILDGMNTNQRQEAIFKELNINMNDYPTKYKRGVCIFRENYEAPIESIIGIEKATELNKLGEKVTRSHFVVDQNIPLFNQDPSYINKYLSLS
jgi:tRNA(His) 5'-end guanylyltransferase